jgi:predicted dehydrogenase
VHIPSSKLNKIFNKETNRRLSVVHQFKYSESVGRVKNLVSSNALGEIEYVKKLFVRERTGRMLHDKSHWSNDLPMGRWQETLPHPLYTIYYLLGGFEATNAKVRILASKDDLKYLIIILEFGDGITFELFFKESNVTRNSSYEITGSSGSISFNNSSFQLMTHSVSSYRKRLIAWIWNIYAEGIVIFEKLKSEVKYYLIKDFRYGNNLHDKFISDFVSYTLNQGKSPASHREIFEIALLTEKIVHEFDEATKNH